LSPYTRYTCLSEDFVRYLDSPVFEIGHFRLLDRNLIMSEDFVRYLDSPVFEIGHFRLRGFSRMQLLFGLPAA
jgi:hypothetical protein